MQIQGVKENDIFFFSIMGRLDTQTYTDAEKQMMAWIEAGNTKMIGDLSDLEFISSAGLRVLLYAAKTLNQQGGKMVLFGVNDQVNEVFEVTGISNVIDITTSKDGAFSLFN
ncbi:anti-sigma factor antagonist [bacterium]|nr:anti-sigma factor antagonist [bacterium]